MRPSPPSTFRWGAGGPSPPPHGVSRAPWAWTGSLLSGSVCTPCVLACAVETGAAERQDAAIRKSCLFFAFGGPCVPSWDGMGPVGPETKFAMQMFCSPSFGRSLQKQNFPFKSFARSRGCSCCPCCLCVSVCWLASLDVFLLCPFRRPFG